MAMFTQPIEVTCSEARNCGGPSTAWSLNHIFVSDTFSHICFITSTSNTNSSTNTGVPPNRNLCGEKIGAIIVYILVTSYRLLEVLAVYKQRLPPPLPMSHPQQFSTRCVDTSQLYHFYYCCLCYSSELDEHLPLYKLTLAKKK